MSRWVSKAERLCDHLRTLEDLDCMAVAVHRENNLLAALQAASAKVKGAGAVLITWIGGTNPDRRSSKLRIGARYSITLSIPKIMGEKVPGDELIEKIAEHIHGWVDATPGSLTHRLEVTSIDLVPDAPSFVIYEILAEISRV